MKTIGQFICTPEHMPWLREYVTPNNSQAKLAKSAILFGDINHPKLVELYSSDAPSQDTKVATYELREAYVLKTEPVHKYAHAYVYSTKTAGYFKSINATTDMGAIEQVKKAEGGTLDNVTGIFFYPSLNEKDMMTIWGDHKK